MQRKGQGISINVIIIAAIALLVLVILAALLFSTGRNLREKSSGCGVDVPGECRQARYWDTANNRGYAGAALNNCVLGAVGVCANRDPIYANAGCNLDEKPEVSAECSQRDSSNKQTHVCCNPYTG